MAKTSHDRNTNERLYEYLTSLDSDSFWKVWRDQNKESGSLVTRVEGETSQRGIAAVFRDHFRAVYSNNSTPEHESLKSEFCQRFSEYYRGHIDDPISCLYISWSEMVDILGKLKIGKSSSGDIRPEHIFYGSEKLAFHLQLLFNGMIQHGVVVTDFLHGTITPIVKDSQGDVSDCANYRGITLGSIYSKLFEMALDVKLAPFLTSDHLQFGFKKQTSTSHALFTLKSTVDYFNSRGSDVFVAFLDCTKAFDRISHHGLFLKLMERRVPLCLLLLIVFWHLNMSCRVKWGDEFSEEFRVPLGTKQGGISSPGFFSLYINDMIELMRKSGLGCHIIRLFLAAILFADDLAILAPSRSALQKLISICEDYCRKFCLQFNSSKSKVMTFGSTYAVPIAPLTIAGDPIDFVSEWKYLGTTLAAGKSFSFTARPDISSFYRATNSVLNVLNGAHKRTLLALLRANCLPILTYACTVKQYSASDMSDCNLAMNNAFRKVFGYTDWRSIRTLREEYSFKSIYEIFKVAQDRFLAACCTHHNPVIKFIASISADLLT